MTENTTEMSAVTNAEQGAYLIAVGRAMIEKDERFSTASEPGMSTERDKLLATMQEYGVQPSRLKFVEDQCWSRCRAIR